MIAQSHISIVQGEIYHKLNNGACAIIPYPTIEVKDIWQVHVATELKIKLVCFFTIHTIIRIFVAVKNRYLNLSTVIKFANIQNETKQAETK